MEKIFGPQGLLARHLPAYEPRPAQLRMAEAVARVLAMPFTDGPANCLLAEAGTGTGKTLAYLIPAALCGQKVVVSTATKTLQDQILDKEIPFIRQHLLPGLRAVCVKGRQNYLCLYRWRQTVSQPQLGLFNRPEEVERLHEWANTTATGDRAEIEWLADDAPLWREISATTAQCLGSACPDFASCFITRLRQQAAASRIVVVNHHLFFSDLALRRFGNAEVLPRYESVIFDEAHHLESVAGQYFGVSFSQYQLVDLAADLRKTASAGKDKARTEAVERVARSLESQAKHLLSLFPAEPGRQPLAPLLERFAGAWNDLVTEITLTLARAADLCAASSLGNDPWSALADRSHTLTAALASFHSGEQEGNRVYWYERRQRSLQLAATPVEVAPELEDFYAWTRSVILTSATLSVGGSFAYIDQRLGLPASRQEVILASPFDHQQKTLLYVPDAPFPLPGAQDFLPACADRICELLRLSAGRALVLFTSLHAMRQAHNRLAAATLPYPLLVQGDAPRHRLLERFRAETHSVLLAVASFWEGIDVPGESLSCVIIDKLPFEAPSDPVLKARIARIEAKGGSPFFDLQVPRAVLALRQGVGRLLRHQNDRGVIAILDRRLYTKGYGRRFRASLPECPVCRDLQAVADFFASSSSLLKNGLCAAQGRAAGFRRL